MKILFFSVFTRFVNENFGFSERYKIKETTSFFLRKSYIFVPGVNIFWDWEIFEWCKSKRRYSKEQKRYTEEVEKIGKTKKKAYITFKCANK